MGQDEFGSRRPPLSHFLRIILFTFPIFSAVCIGSCGVGGMCMRPGLCLCATGQISPSCGGGGAIGGGQAGTGMFHRNHYTSGCYSW